MANSILINEPTADQAAFCHLFMEGVRKALGDKLYSLYIYGAMVFPRPVSWHVDVDFHVIVASPLDEVEGKRIKDLHARLSRENPLGDELDGYYLLVDHAKRKENPRNIIWTTAVDFAWALHRAHIHAGRFRLLYGKDPRAFLPRPKWAECVEGLENERRFAESVPEHPQFGVLNCSRLLLSWQTQNVVASKYEAAQWALQTLDAAWHPAIQAAVRDYVERPQAGDIELLRRAYPDFQAYCESEIERIRRSHTS